MIHIAWLEHRCDHDPRFEDHKPIFLAILPVERCLNAPIGEPCRQRRPVVRPQGVMIHTQIAEHFSGQHAVGRRPAIRHTTKILNDAIAIFHASSTRYECFSLSQADKCVLEPVDVRGDGHHLHDAPALRVFLSCRICVGEVDPWPALIPTWSARSDFAPAPFPTTATVIRI